MSTVEVPNPTRYLSCKCPVHPNQSFLLVLAQASALDHHHPHSGGILGAASHLDSRTRSQTKVRVEGFPLVRIRRHLKAQVGDFHSPQQSLQRMRRLLGSHLANPRQIASLRLPLDSRLINRVQKQPTQHPLGSLSRHPSQSNTRRVLRSDRHYPNLRVHLLPPGLLLDRLSSPSNQQILLRSRLVLPQVVGDLDLRLPVLRLVHSRWHLRRLRRSHLQGPQVHHHNNLRRIHLGLVRAHRNLRLLLRSRVSR